MIKTDCQCLSFFVKMLTTVMILLYKLDSRHHKITNETNDRRSVHVIISSDQNGWGNLANASSLECQIPNEDSIGTSTIL